jgi:glutamate-1-semialdehyde 2,1-aminomutase
VPEDFAKHTLVLDYNNAAQLEEAFKAPATRSPA